MFWWSCSRISHLIKIFITGSTIPLSSWNPRPCLDPCKRVSNSPICLHSSLKTITINPKLQSLWRLGNLQPSAESSLGAFWARIRSGRSVCDGTQNVKRYRYFFSGTKFFRYRYQYFFQYQIFLISVPRLFSDTKFYLYRFPDFFPVRICTDTGSDTTKKMKNSRYRKFPGTGTSHSEGGPFPFDWKVLTYLQTLQRQAPVCPFRCSHIICYHQFWKSFKTWCKSFTPRFQRSLPVRHLATSQWPFS